MSTRALACLLLLLLGCDSNGRRSSPASVQAGIAAGASRVVVQLGPDLPPAVAARIASLVVAVEPRPVDLLGASDPLPPLAPGSLVLAVGDALAARDLIADGEVAALGSEAFVLRSQDRQGVLHLAARGAPRRDRQGLVQAGNAYGAYAALEALGLAFLHPLQPTLPPLLSAPAGLDRREAPRWPERGIHLHTMHPTELTDLLAGWGPAGPADLAGWRAMLPEWERACEWMLANRQNMVEWFILSASSWEAFADSPERQARLRELVDVCHAFGLRAGGDAPIALAQQHTWRLLRRLSSSAQEAAEIESRVDWLEACGFDFLATELGFSEFTHPEDQKMVDWLDVFARRAKRHGMGAYSKIHVSQGQVSRTIVDPLTGGPLNFNFLPRVCDPHLGVMPHSVQHYALDDPAPTYGLTDFGFMRAFMQEEAGARKVLWHPETAYWVSFDVDVPLFLPLYVDGRVRDMRLIAGDEDAGRTGRGVHAGAPIDGQMFFSSGWEWGYWLNDVVAARSAWDPHAAAPTREAALRRALAPLTDPMGPAGPALADALLEVIAAQRELLIEGKVNGVPPTRIVKRNGQAYLQGCETWDEVNAIVQHLPIPGLGKMVTQPDKLPLHDLTFFDRIDAPDYAREVEPLLAEMSRRFAGAADAVERCGAQVPPHLAAIHAELADGARITALRARQVHGLYDWARSSQPLAWRLTRLAEARAALDAAAPIVSRREAAYRVPADRIAGWRDGPTSYEQGYLWTARSLHYWWRDEGRAVDRPRSPSYLNFINPMDVAFGERWVPLTEAVRAVGQAQGWSSITDFLAPPPAEPSYPPAGLRQRP